MFHDSFSGIVLFVKTYKEHDGIVKIFTKEHGKQMFFIRQYKKKNHPLHAALIPFTRAEFVGKINRNGLSFVSEAKEVTIIKQMFDNIDIQAYTAYLVALADAVIEDRIVQKNLYDLLYNAINAIENGIDIQLVTLLFELQLLPLFGVHINLDTCALTGLKKGPFDFSMQYGGVIDSSVFDDDQTRLHGDPNAIYLLQQLSKRSFDQLQSINVSQHTKNNMRFIMDSIYDEYVGIQLKSKKFIDKMNKWDTSPIVIKKRVVHD